jgi:hypothetical protein
MAGMTTVPKHAVLPDRDTWTTIGIWVVGAAGAVMSWTGWWLLAVMCGWSKALAAVLPLSVDVYVITSARVWLRLPWVTDRTRRFAAASTMLAVLFSIAANAAYHLMNDLGMTRAPWGVVVAVSGLPPLMLALVAHLQARLNADRQAAVKAAEDAAEAAARKAELVAQKATAPRRPKRQSARQATATTATGWRDKARDIVAANPRIRAAELALSCGTSKRTAERFLAEQSPEAADG